MRKEKHRMLPEECEAFLARAEVLRLGLADEDGPYVVPVNFGYEDGRLYVHGPAEGRRLDAIAANPRVCFEADECEIVRAVRSCGFTARFRSVIGYGSARVLTDDGARRRGLDVLMRHYGGTGADYDERVLAQTSVIEIEIDSMDGKRHLVDG
jgi:nitroimidazol reductase NimA-like FMN-containing flavoprotein (pyridoxamine 5'-phosphate oxidase superfamily)